MRDRVYFELAKCVEAISNLTEAIALSPYWAKNYSYRVLAKVLLGEYQKAIADLAKARNFDLDLQQFFLRTTNPRTRLETQ